MSEITEHHDKNKASQWPSSCKICQDTWQRFSDPESTHQVKLGNSFEDALADECPTHKPITRSFIDYVCSDGGGDEIGESKDVGITEGSKGHSVTMVESVTELGVCWNLLLVKDNSKPSHPGTGRILDPDWVDLDMLREWKHECLSAHGATCESPIKIWRERPNWVIDVEKRCLVPGNTEGGFVALSYKSGRRDAGLTIDAETLARLQEPHALDSPEFSQYLDPTLRHAVHLATAIGERYLWADALCITHDDRGATTEQLQMMGAIYANATVTIIAADGDSQNGLLGLKGVSESRKIVQKVIPFGDEQLIVRNTDIFSMSGGRPYYDRAWTSQEYSMSRRKIIFNNYEIHWECQCSVWHEEMVLGAEIDKYIDHSLNIILAGFPDLGAFNFLVSHYNEKEFRYDDDALPAISGLLSVASRPFTGGFLYGIPEMFFERGLGWKPMWDHTNLRRRTPSERPAARRLSPCDLPSWSWVGWHGLITGGYGEAARINSSRIEETIPITEWYTSNSPDDTPMQKRRIRSTWFENRDSYKNLSRPLPPGWTRHEAPMTTSEGEPYCVYPDGCEKYIYKHASMKDPGNEETEPWYYPFPVPEIGPSTPPFTPEQTQYLFCQTKGVQLWGHAAGDEDENIVKLRNNSGEEIGELHLHNEESLARFTETLAEGVTGLPVELVAIYKSVRYSTTWNEVEEKSELPLNRDEVYVVLWVEWKDGVAHRSASGRVEAAAWDKLNLRDVSLVLG